MLGSVGGKWMPVYCTPVDGVIKAKPDAEAGLRTVRTLVCFIQDVR